MATDVSNFGSLDVQDHDGSSVGLKLGGTLVTLTAAQLNKAVQGYAAGYAVARGTQAATDTAAVVTGLSTITGYAVSPIAASTTTLYAAPVVTAKAQASTAGTLAIYRWKFSGATTSTLVAATTAGTVSWIAVGT